MQLQMNTNAAPAGWVNKPINAGLKCVQNMKQTFA